MSRGVKSRVGDRLLHGYTWLVILWLSSPIAVMILFGFNDKKSKSNTSWQGFTLKWYGELFEISDLTTALRNSIVIALVSTVITVVIGTMLGLAVGRYRFRGLGATNFLVFAAISTPELVMGASLLSLFVSGNVPRDSATIIVAHVLFSLSFVVVTVRARVITLDPSLEEAAKDLGATAWGTFRQVTLPSIRWGLAYGVTLTVARSLGEFGALLVVSGNTLGRTQTATLYVHDGIESFNTEGAYAASVLLAGVSFVMLIGMEMLRKRVAAHEEAA